MKNVVIVNLYVALIGGVVSGFVVYGIIEWVERKRWESVKKQLVEFLNITLNWILTSIRNILEVPSPSKIRSDEDYIKFFQREVLDNFERFRSKIEYMDVEKQNTLLSSFNSIQDSLRYLGVLFTSVKTAEPWYLNTIFEIQKKFFDALIPYLTFPEIGKSEYKNKKEFLAWRKIAFKNIYELCKYVIEAKNNFLIKNIVDKEYK